jgi:hypothetical protein
MSDGIASGCARVPDARLWWAALGAICVALLAPLFLVDVPPMLDYPNHLARGWFLAFGAEDPVLSKIYSAHWGIIPNLATDIIWPPMMHVLPVYVAGRVVVGLLVLLPVFGAVAYHRAMFGLRSWWPLASALVGYHAAVLLGFVNFDISLGVALLLAAAWVAWRNAYPVPTVVLVSLGTIGLFFCHLMGLVFFIVLVGTFEMECIWRARRLSVIATRALVVLPVLAGPAWLYLHSILGDASPDIHYLPPAEKALQLFMPFLNYDYALDVASALFVVGFLAICLATRRGIMTLASALAMIAILALFLVSPFAFKGTAALDTRFPIMLGFLLFAAVRPRQLPRWAVLAATPVFVTLFAVRMAVLALAWHGHAADLAGLRAVTAGLAPGDRVYVTAVTPAEAPEYWRHGPVTRRLSNGIRLDYHMAALVLIERRAFWPYLFAEPSQQPIRLDPTWQARAEQAAVLPSHRLLADCNGGGEGGPAENVNYRGYNYVLMLEAGGEPDLANFAADRLALVASSDMAALFRIRTPAPPCALKVSAF